MPEIKNDHGHPRLHPAKTLTKEQVGSVPILDREDQRPIDEIFSERAHDPIYRAVASTLEYETEETPLAPSVKTLEDQAKAVSNGDMTGIEKVLTVEINTLDLLFNNLIQRASRQANPQRFDELLKLALRAQANLTMTIRALAEVKTPRAISFIKQQNNGEKMLVNNGVITGAQERPSLQNELSERGECVEILGRIGAKTAGRTDPVMASMAEVHRTSNGRRKREVGA